MMTRIASSILRILLAACALVVVSRSALLAQTSEPAKAGTEFYVAYMLNEDHRSAAPRFMGLMISSEVTTTVNVDVPGAGTTSYIVRAGKPTTVSISRTLEMDEVLTKPAIHITSRAPVAVYVLNALYQSSGGYAALPVDRWGTSYLPMSLPNADGERVGEFVVIASVENTILTIVPSAQTNYRDKGESFTTVLHKGEAYLVQGRPGGTGTADLSVSEISATAPVGVICGHVRAPITSDRSMPLDQWASHMVTMALPDNAWGREYYTAPMRPTSNRFRMTAALDNTVVEITQIRPGKAPEHVTVTLNRGNVYDSATVNGQPITGAVHWSASKPVLLMQFRTSGSYGDAANAPAMLAVPAVDQFTTMSPFVAPLVIGTDGITSHTLTIIAHGDAGRAADDPANPINGLTLNDVLLKDVAPGLVWQQIEGGYFTTQLTIAAGAYVLAAPGGASFSASIAGNDGSIGDFYTFQLPFWVPKTDADLAAPYMVNAVPVADKRHLIVRISDRTPSYFSGVADVAVVNSPNWKLDEPFTPSASVDDDAMVTFTVTSDPSGPLYAALRDWNGNIDTVMLSAGLCAQAAYADRTTINIDTRAGVARRDSVAIRANQCGDAARIVGIDLGNGTAKNHMTVHFGSGLPLPIASNDVVMLYFDVAATAPVGISPTTITLQMDTGAITLSVNIVATTSGVASSADASGLAMTLTPNPLTTTSAFTFAHPLGTQASLVLTDALGRSVRRVGNDVLAGATTFRWDGTGDDGALLPAGVYIATLVDGAGRAVLSTRLVR